MSKKPPHSYSRKKGASRALVPGPERLNLPSCCFHLWCRMLDWTEEQCVLDPYCYPSHVRVHGIQGYVQSTGKFTVSTLFDDILYVWLEGPELIAAHIHPMAISGGVGHQFNVSFNVRVKGNYQLHVRVDQVGRSRIGFHRELFESPFAIFANGSLNSIDLGGRPTCTSVSAASHGSWFHHHYLRGDDFRKVVAQARNDYVWVPSSCRLMPLWDRPAQLRNWYSKRICALGDSYLRSLLAAMLHYNGLTSLKQLLDTENLGNDWHAANTSMFWHNASAAWPSCAREADVIIMTWLTRVPEEYMQILHARSSKVSYIYMLPHPWSGDALLHKRDNIQLRRSRAEQIAMLPKHVDIFDVWLMTHARHDQVCDQRSHFVCMSNQIRGLLPPVGLWEGIVLAHGGGSGSPLLPRADTTVPYMGRQDQLLLRPGPDVPKIH